MVGKRREGEGSGGEGRGGEGRRGKGREGKGREGKETRKRKGGDFFAIVEKSRNDYVRTLYETHHHIHFHNCSL